MLQVGILPPHNQEQLDFAFSVYQTPGDKGYALSKEFKRTFAYVHSGILIQTTNLYPECRSLWNSLVFGKLFIIYRANWES